ncbi:MAG TPA: radical SAM protein [Planctomycetota bacterium]|nr:radical SAM protein [Planctomycetota bacterium]
MTASVPQVRLVHKKSSTFHDFPYTCSQRKCIHNWIVNVTPPGFSHCIHQCLYCYARDAIFAQDSGGALEVYDNLPELVARDLDRMTLCPPISISNTTDPCQAVPEVRREVARLVRLLVERGLSFLVITKGDATFLLDVPGFAAHPNKVVATTIEGPPEVLRLLSPRAPAFDERLGSVRRLAERGVKTAVRLDPMLPHVYQTVYGERWFKQVEGLVARFAEAGCGHVICSTGRLTRKAPAGHSSSSFQRLEALMAELSPSAAEGLRRDYAFDRSGTSTGYLWRRPLRLAFHRRLRAVCEAHGMTYATCQENAPEETDSPGLPSCEGYALPFCVKGLGGAFHPVEGCTAFCHVRCKGLARPPCGRPELVSHLPLRISLLR